MQTKNNRKAHFEGLLNRLTKSDGRSTLTDRMTAISRNSASTHPLVLNPAKTLSPSVPELTLKYAGIWQNLPAEVPDGVRCFTEAEQSEREERVEKLIQDVKSSGGPAAARSTIRRFVAEAEAGEMRPFRKYSDSFMGSSKTFVERARAFDRKIGEEEIHQALRNLWVFNALQLLFAARVRFQPGAFAYSLLYPSTDNFFDNPRVRSSRKHTFGSWVSRRLSGETHEPGVGVAGKVHRLIRLIEKEYPRSKYPLVYEGLRAIHDAQLAAMGMLQDGPVPGILWKSVRKGGTSVLADALLIRGRLQQHEVEFSFRFGMLLQLIDDLQDGRDDGSENAVTLFSTGRTRAELHESACRLLHFLRETFEPESVPFEGEGRTLTEFMRRSCIALIGEAVCRQDGRFGRDFMERIAPFCPLHPRYLVSLHKRAPALRRLCPGGIRVILAATD